MADKRQEQFDSLMARLEAKMPPEAAAQVKAAFAIAPEAALELGEGFLAKEDYGRHIREVTEKERLLAEEQNRVVELAKQVSGYEAQLRTSFMPRDQYDAAVAERNRLQQQLDQLSTEYPTLVQELGLTPATTPTGTGDNNNMFTHNNSGNNQNQNQNQSPANPAAQPVAPIRNITAPEWDQDKRNLAALAILSPAEQHDLAVRHQQVFGTQLPNMKELVNAAASTGRSLEDVWAEKYDVAAQLQKLEQERFEKTVQERTDQEVAKRLGASVVNGGTGIPNNHNVMSPFLQRIQPGQDPAQVQGVAGAPDMTRIANQGTGQGAAANAATQAYLSGKYRNEKFDILTS